MAVKITTKELVECACLEPITIYTEAVQFGQPLLTTVATVRYVLNVTLFHMLQPHQCLLATVVITRVPPVCYKSDSVGIQESFTQQLIARRRDCYRLEKYRYVPNL